MNLCDLRPGECGCVHHLTTGPDLHRRLLDMGLIEGTEVACLFTSPLGDPSAFLIRGAVIALRREDSKTIHILA